MSGRYRSLIRKRVRDRQVRSLASFLAAAISLSALVGLSAAPALAASSAHRTITYHGYRFEVPASWPVYNLAANPRRCVLFNRDAVYLGTPGPDQRCPSRAYGRAGAILVQPASTAGELPPGTVQLRAGTAALATRATLPARSAALAAASHLLRISVPAAGIIVTTSYGTDLAQMRGILAGAAATKRARTPAGGTQSAASRPPAAGRTSQDRAASRPAGAAANAGAAAAELTDVRGSGLGFDACTAPSVQNMASWLTSPYRTIGTYLGGDNWACDYGNFNASWVQQVAAMGWRFIPIWVGPQAPCTGIYGAVTIDPSDATAQGESEAASAAATAQSFGYGTGTPIYFDMEGYDNSDTACSQAVLSFLDGWTEGLHAAGYLSGVYSSAGSGMVDLASEYGQAGYASPDDVWIADWNGSPQLTDPYVPDADWADHQRLHQYYGGHNETWGGVTLNIDNDSIGGDLAGSAAAPAGPRPVLYGAPDAVTVAPGQARTVALVLHAPAGQGTGAPVRWQVSAPAGVNVTPASGSEQLAPGGNAVVPVRVTVQASMASGRYDLPVTATAGSVTLTETFELVTVTAAGGGTVATPFPVVLYAADPASMAVAVSTAARLGLPASDVTGNFEAAWNDVNNGNDLVLSVGQAAGNALNQNPCGWTNPAGTAAGSTPFYYIGVPLTGPAGPDVFEPSGGSSPALTALVTTQLMHFALAGTLPDDGGQPDGPVPPADTCLGSASVPVP
jgi:glycoside hydrolase-like protein